MAASSRIDIQQFYARFTPTTRYQNLKVELRTCTDELLFQAGGTWDGWIVVLTR